MVVDVDIRHRHLAVGFSLGDIQRWQDTGENDHEIRVVNKDGSRPNLGSFFMRWLLGNIDIGCSCVGILFILLTKDSQRLGDLAAGTMVIKEVNIEDIHVSLDEFYYAKKDYHPTYEEAKNLSQAQVEVIEKTVYSGNDKHEEQVDALARKVVKFLDIEERLKASLQKEIARKIPCYYPS